MNGHTLIVACPFIIVVMNEHTLIITCSFIIIVMNGHTLIITCPFIIVVMNGHTLVITCPFIIVVMNRQTYHYVSIYNCCYECVSIPDFTELFAQSEFEDTNIIFFPFIQQIPKYILPP